MPHTIPATILGILAGTAVSMTGGTLLGAYVVTGVAPVYAAAPLRIRPEPALVDPDTWPALDALGPVQRAADDQAFGVRASGSSSE